MGSSMLFNDSCPQKIELKPSESVEDEANQQFAEARKEHGHNYLSPAPKDTEEGWWHMDFDGEVSREGTGAGI